MSCRLQLDDEVWVEIRILRHTVFPPPWVPEGIADNPPALPNPIVEGMVDVAVDPQVGLINQFVEV